MGERVTLEGTVEGASEEVGIEWLVDRGGQESTSPGALLRTKTSGEGLVRL